MKLVAEVSSFCFAGGKEDTKTLKAAAVAGAAAVYFIFAGCDDQVVSVVWSMPWEGSGN